MMGKFPLIVFKQEPIENLNTLSDDNSKSENDSVELVGRRR